MSSVSPAGGAEGSAGSGLGAVRFSFVDFSFRLKTECQLRHTFSSPPAPFQEAFARDILRKVPEGRDSHLVFWRPLFCDGKKALSDAPRARDGSVLRYKLCKLRSPWALTVLWTSFKIFPRKIFSCCSLLLNCFLLSFFAIIHVWLQDTGRLPFAALRETLLGLGCRVSGTVCHVKKLVRRTSGLKERLP